MNFYLVFGLFLLVFALCFVLLTLLGDDHFYSKLIMIAKPIILTILSMCELFNTLSATDPHWVVILMAKNAVDF